ncbi:hypothetical protein FRB94_005105 [Tulasnella sp. JGI-2019a]|nr:hypothetical protein FRB94_005105 [Tulasnella sp. JGI-2019a]KAG9026505.1 hypothetical protein FRB95_008731 [Tulasnella sp. JGI-2019a]
MILMIMGHLNSRDMYSALQTCRAMRSIVETCLYAHILIPPHHHERMARLLRTLHARPDFAHNIISFGGSLYPALPKSRLPRVITPTSLVKNWCQRWSTKQPDPQLTVISIHRMVNVRLLTLYDFAWLGTISETLVRDAICSTISLTSLTTLVIDGRDFFRPGLPPGYNRELSLILRHQPLLERLELRSGDWDLGQWILPTDVPRLAHLMSPPAEARVLVSRRPIKSLVLRNVYALPDQVFWGALAASTGPIHTLKVDILHHVVLLSFLDSLSVNLHDIQHLTLNGPDYEHLPMLTQKFPSLPSLCTLRIILWEHQGYQMDGADIDRLREDLRADLTARVQLGCPQLESIDYGHFTGCGCLSRSHPPAR